MQTGPAALRALPPMPRLLDAAEAAGFFGQWPRAAVASALRAELGRIRSALLEDGHQQVPDDGAILQAAAAQLAHGQRPTLRRVLNATGIVIHTNLGRAPLAPEAIEAAADAARSCCNLEFDLDTGRRGARAPGVEQLLCALTGAEAGLAVNNNAAAMLLALTALASGGEVIVSRGELVEIGGGFRIPDIIAQGGARLVEVGTTNKTRVADYAAAITPATRILLKVHQSNFRIVGFTEEAGLAELATLARAHGLLLLNDLGSGTLAPLPRHFAHREPTVRESIAAGSDVVAFSGDKLLGGPQAGLLAGRDGLIATMRRHPLQRALRLDKMTLGALEATLRLHTDPATAQARIPVLRILAQTEATLAGRAASLAASLGGQPGGGLEALGVPSVGHAGGGALPGQDIASHAVRLSVPGLSADALARGLRAGRPAVAARIHDGHVLLDVLALSDADLPEVVAAVRDIASGEARACGG